MFETVAHQLGHQQAVGHGGFERSFDGVDLRVQANAADLGACGVAQVAQQISRVGLQRHRRQRARLVQLFVHQRHRMHTLDALVQGRAGCTLGQGAALQAQQALHHLQVVLDAVIDLAQQRLTFFERQFDAALLSQPLGHVGAGGIEAQHPALRINVGHEYDFQRARLAVVQIFDLEALFMASQHLVDMAAHSWRRLQTGNLLPRAAEHGVAVKAEAKAMGAVDEAVAQVPVNVGDAHRQVVGDGAQESFALLSLVARQHHCGLRHFAVGDVADQRHAKRVPAARGFGDRNVDRELCAVLAPAAAFDAFDAFDVFGAHRPSGCLQGAGWPEARHQLRRPLSDQRLGLIAEHRRAGPVGRLDQSVGAQRQDAVGRMVNDGRRALRCVRQRGLCRFAPGMRARHGRGACQQQGGEHDEQHRVQDHARPPFGQHIGHRHPHRHHQRVLTQCAVAENPLSLVTRHHLLHGARRRGRQVHLEQQNVQPVAGEESVVARRGGHHPAVAQEQGHNTVAVSVHGVQHGLQCGGVNHRHQCTGKAAVRGHQAACDGQPPGEG